MAKVVVLGASGMLGSAVAQHLHREGGLRVTATVRSSRQLNWAKNFYSGIDLQILDAWAPSREDLSRACGEADWVVNCVGIIRHQIDEKKSADVERAIRVNSIFPHSLCEVAVAQGARVIQIATDCVFSGSRGHYTVGDPHDALDVYGKTKSLGEVASPTVVHLRCSIVGREPQRRISLLEWLLHQPERQVVPGYVNHYWNGITTWHFAKIVQGIINSGRALSGVHHVVPTGMVTKAELLREIADSFGRTDLIIDPIEAPQGVDRTLVAEEGSENRRMWEGAGHPEPPSISQMMMELAEILHTTATLTA